MKSKHNNKAKTEKFVLSKLSPKNRAQISFNPGASKNSADKPSADLNAIHQLSTEPASNSPSGEGAQRQIAERVLTMTQRRKRGNVMRRLAQKFARLRQMKRLRMAPEERLKFRAKALARTILRRRLAGERGKNYSTLSPSDKMAVDKIIDSRTKFVKKIAVRLLPVVRKAELIRLKAARGGTKAPKPYGTSGAGLINNSYEEQDDIITEHISLSILEGSADTLDGLMRAGLADKSSLNIYKKAVDNPDYAEKYSVYRKKIFSLFDKLVKIVLKNPAIYTKVKTDVQRAYQRDSVKEEVLDEAVKKKPRGRPPGKNTFSNQKLAYMARQGDKEAAKILAVRKREKAATPKTNTATKLLKDVAAGKAKLGAKEIDLLAKSLKTVHKDKIVRALQKGAQEVAKKETSTKIKKQKVFKKAADEYSSMADAISKASKQQSNKVGPTDFQRIKAAAAAPSPTTTSLPTPVIPAPTAAAKKTRTAKRKPRPRPAKPMDTLFQPATGVSVSPTTSAAKAPKYVVNVNPLIKQKRRFLFSKLFKDRGDKNSHVSKFLSKLELIHGQQQDPVFKQHIANAAETIGDHWRNNRTDQAYVLARNVHRNLKKLGVHESFLPKASMLEEKKELAGHLKKHPSRGDVKGVPAWPRHKAVPEKPAPKPRVAPKKDRKPVKKTTSPRKRTTPVTQRGKKPTVVHRSSKTVTEDGKGNRITHQRITNVTNVERPGGEDNQHSKPGAAPRHPASVLNKPKQKKRVLGAGKSGQTNVKRGAGR